MKRLIEKLRARGGASMLFALTIFLLCALAGTVILTTAAANIGRYTHLEEEQRQYLSVASALDLIQGQLDTKKPVVTVKYVKQEKWYYETGSSGTPELKHEEPAYTLSLESPAPGTAPNYFQNLLLINCVPEEWYENTKSNTGADNLQKPDEPTPPLPVKNYVIRMSDADPAWGKTIYPTEVTATPQTLGDYTLGMLFRARTAGGSGSAYPLKAVWSGEVSTDTNTVIETTGGIDSDPSVPVVSLDGTFGTRTTTTTLTCTLTWSAEDRAVTFE